MFSWCVDMADFCRGREEEERLILKTALVLFPPTLSSDDHCFVVFFFFNVFPALLTPSLSQCVRTKVRLIF